MIRRKNTELYSKGSDCRTTDWQFDFACLARWKNRDSIPYVYDKFYPIPQSDMLCCIYSIAEVSMGRYTGFLALLKNKENPELVLDIAEGMNFCDNFSINKNGDIIFLQQWIYNNVDNEVRCPILIMDLLHERFAYYDTDNYNSCYKVVEIGDGVFVIEADETQRKNDERLNALSKQIIDLSSLEWFDFAKLSTI